MDAALLAALDKLTETLHSLQAGGEGAFALQLYPPPSQDSPSALTKAPLSLPQAMLGSPLQLNLSFGERGPVLSCAVAFGPGAQASCNLTSNGVEARANCGPSGRLNGPGKHWDGVVREAGRRTRRAFYKPEPEPWSESESNDYVDSEDSAKPKPQAWVQRTSLPSPPSSSSERTKAVHAPVTQAPAPNLPKELDEAATQTQVAEVTKTNDLYDPQWWVKGRKATPIPRPAPISQSSASEAGSRRTSPYNPHWWVKDRKMPVDATAPVATVVQPQASQTEPVQPQTTAPSTSSLELVSRPTSPYNPHWWMKDRSQTTQPAPAFREPTSRPGSDSGSRPTSPYNPHWWVSEKRKRSDSTTEPPPPAPSVDVKPQLKVATQEPTSFPVANAATESHRPASPTGSASSAGSQGPSDPKWWTKKRPLSSAGATRAPSPSGPPTSPYDPHWWVKGVKVVQGPKASVDASVPDSIVPTALSVAQVVPAAEPKNECKPVSESAINPKPVCKVHPIVQESAVKAEAAPHATPRPAHSNDRKVKVRMRRGLPFFEDPRHRSSLVDLEYPTAHSLPAHSEGCAICDRRAIRSALFPHVPPGCAKFTTKVGPGQLKKVVPTQTAKAVAAPAANPAPPKVLKLFDPTGGKVTPAGFIHAPLPRMAKREFPAPIASDR